MNISTPIYEKLPYIYMSSAVFLLFYSSDLFVFCSCALLYLAGSVTAVQRSNNRRRNKAKNTITGFKLSSLVYEFYPFAFIALSVILIRFYPEPASLGLAIVMFLYATKNLLLRRQSRFNKMKFNNTKVKR